MEQEESENIWGKHGGDKLGWKSQFSFEPLMKQSPEITLDSIYQFVPKCII